MFRLFDRKRARRVLLLGLDCASPQLIFEDFKADLPNLARLVDGGTWGTLESCIPCITVPAWSSMTSSHDPGVLGCYGFRNRTDHSYDALAVASGSTIQAKRVWDYLGEAGKQSIVTAVPQTYPVRPLNGQLVAGFPAPGIESAFTYPAILKTEVQRLAPNYPFDVNNFRTDDKNGLLQRILDFTEIQYRVVEHLLTSKPWDFFMHVNMGVDRIHHGFWRYHDPQHRLYEAGNPYEHAIREYYQLVDGILGRLVERAGDDTIVMIASDHGVKRMDGAICLNEWLWQNGWLTLKNPPRDGEIIAFDEANVDWTQTRAWGSGGYYGRVYLNVAGREPQGVIPPAALAEVRAELTAALKAIPDADGNPLNTQVYYPEQIYDAVNGVAPDLIVYFGDLHWRSVGSLGYGRHYTLENDTGPDDANHAMEGMFIIYDPRKSGAGQAVNAPQLMDITPTILQRMGVQVPHGLQGQVI